jgi:hypothetical protein
MSDYFQPGVRYRAPVSFGPAVGPRQHPEGRPWTKQETGTMRSDWMKLSYRTDPDKLQALLPPGFALRAEPVLSISCARFEDLYWLAGRSYGILSVDFPVTYHGATETIEGSFCPVIWEGQPEAITTGREELGFPKLFADISPIRWESLAGTATCSASWMGFDFFDIELHDMQVDPDPTKALPGSGGGPQLYYRYMPHIGPRASGGADAAYAVTAAPVGATGLIAQNISFEEFEFRRWTAQGSLAWHRATFAELPIQFNVVNGMADLDILEVVDAEMVSFSGPGIAIATDGMRPIEPRELVEHADWPAPERPATTAMADDDR